MVLLAGAATGCSSDVSRFDGIFSSKPDTLTTASVPHKNNAVNGKLPTPSASVQAVQASDADVTGDQALNQPYPGNQDISYDPVSTSTIDTQSAVRPMKVERTELSTPGAKVEAKVTRLTEQLQHECPHWEMSHSGVDQTDLGNPAKVWACDNCGKQGTSNELFLVADRLRAILDGAGQ